MIEPIGQGTVPPAIGHGAAVVMEKEINKYAETYVRLSLYPMHKCITDTSAPSITKAIQILPIGTPFHLLLRAGKEMPATARIEAYLVRMLIRDLDELLIKGW